MNVAVAGAGGSLGPVVCEQLVAAGHTVFAADLAGDKLRSDWNPSTVDLTSEDSTEAWAASIEPVDAVLHLVGGWRAGSGAEDTEWLHRLLTYTVQVATRSFAPKLKASGGRFAIVSAAAAQDPPASNAGYAAAKAAAEAWTLSFGAELAEHGGAANVVVVKAIGDAKPSFTPPADIAAALVWLLSPAAAKVNRQRLHLHG